MKPVIPPSRAAAATRNSAPTSATATVASPAFAAALPGMAASVAARIAAEEEVGDTIAKRLRPIAA